MKKIVGLVLLVVLSLGLTACNKDDADEIEKMYDTVTELSTGFTSLENTHANPPLVDGKYTVGTTEFSVLDTYNTYYRSEVTEEKFNYLTANSQWNSLMYTNMVDGLVENDQYGSIIGAMAVGYKVETVNGYQVYTFQIRENVQWIDNQTGLPYAEVVAADFVSGIEYVLNPTNGSQTTTIVQGFLKGATEYAEALGTTDAADDLAFSTVGVKEVSKYEVSYTLKEPAPYFLSALTYSPFLPVNSDYLAEVGTAFGVTENYVLVNGCFRITKHIYENTFEMTKNGYYYDYDHVYVNTVNLRYVPNAATPSTLREWYEADLIDNFTVSADDETGWSTYVTGGTSGSGTVNNPANSSTNGVLVIGDVVYAGVWNFDRDTYEYGTDFTNSGANVPAKTADQEAATKQAILNNNFRLGALYGFDFMARLDAQPEPSMLIMRAYTNRELTAFEGKDYADYVDEVYNREQGTTGISLSGSIQGDDPIFDIGQATTYFTTAKTELLAAGLEESDFPITIDFLANRSATRQAYELALWQDIIDAVGPDSANPVIDVRFNVAGSDALRSEWNWESINYDITFGGGWGPDYADAKTYLHTIIIGGDFQSNFGLLGDENTQAAKDVIAQSVFGDYQTLYDAAVAIVDPFQTDARYKALAEAEYNAIFVSALNIPWQTTTSVDPVVSNYLPFQQGKAAYGLTNDKFKNIIVADSVITQDQRTEIIAVFEEKR